MCVCLFGIYGCRDFDKQDANESPTLIPTAASPQSVPEGKASLAFTFVIPGSKSREADIRSLITAGTIRVVFVLKLLNEGNVTTPYIEMRKEIPVINGSASGSFIDLPLHSLVAEVQILGGTKSGYADYHGAVDLENGSNTVAVAGVGSKDEPDLLAAAIKELNSKPEYIQYVKPKMASLVKSAITTSTGIVGSTSTRLRENIREVYLAQNTASGTAEANPYVDSTKNYITSFWEYKGKTLVSTQTASIRNDIRAAIGFWSWDWWINEGWYWSIDIGRNSRYAYYFGDPYGYQYPAIFDSTSIDRLVTGSLIYYAADYWGYDIVTLKEIYVYTFQDGFREGTNFMVRVTGLGQAWYNSLKIYQVESNVEADVRESYPASGAITIMNSNGGRASVSFDGTCVAKVGVTYFGGASESFRLLLGKPTAP